MSHNSKKEAEETAAAARQESLRKKGQTNETPTDENTVVAPLIIKADVVGTLEAIEKEISKIKKDGIIFKIVQKGCGSITETDIKLASGMEKPIVVGFNVKIDKTAVELADSLGVPVNNFNIIYKLTEWLDEEMERRRPRVAADETTGSAKILKCFSRTKDKQVVGGRILSGSIFSGAKVKIMRREFEIGRGEIEELQQNKAKTKEVSEGEFGVNVEAKTEIAPGDVIEAFISVTK